MLDNEGVQVFVQSYHYQDTKPVVVKDGQKIGELSTSVLRESGNAAQQNFKDFWHKSHRLAVSLGNDLVLLDTNRSLVRYAWSNIHNSIFNQAQSQADYLGRQGQVADFITHNNSLVVLFADGRLMVKDS